MLSQRYSQFVLATVLSLGCGSDGVDLGGPPDDGASDDIASVDVSPDTAVLRLAAQPTLQLTGDCKERRGTDAR